MRDDEKHTAPSPTHTAAGEPMAIATSDAPTVGCMNIGTTNPATAPADRGGTMTQYRADSCHHEAGHVVSNYRYSHGIQWASVWKDGSGGGARPT